MKKIFPVVIAVLFAFIALFPASSCKKDDDEVTSPLPCLGGPGGDVDISFFVRHHDSIIPGAMIYIAYDDSTFPGTDSSAYDVIILTADTGHGAGHAHIKNMRCGNYFVYSEGYDTDINDSVFGGIPFTVTQREGEYIVNVPVTE